MTSTDEGIPTAPELSAHQVGPRPRPLVRGFVILYCAEAPERAGAFIPVPGSPGSAPRIFGRGATRAPDNHVRLQAIFQRPGENLPLPPFENASLSRVQLEVTRTLPGLDLLNVGGCSLSINGNPCARGSVRVSDIVEIGRQLVLLCVERPETIADDGGRASHALCGPDEHGIVGESPAAWQLRQEIRFVSARTGHVLILGSSGTGKELVAAAIHRLSRPDKAWVARNAGTFPESLIDAELFGNTKGYPNVGMPERKGLIGAADDGSLFLDEFAELPLTAQTHLLRVLDEGEYQRLGEATARRSDFRLIAATNRPVTDLRPDVLARFAFQVRVPDLAERREDIPLLAQHWLRQLTKDDQVLARRLFAATGEPPLAPDFVAALVQRPLPGNAREVRNLLWQAISSSQGAILALPSSSTPNAAQLGGELGTTAAQLQAALEANGGSIERTWRALGLTSRFALMRLMKKNALQIQKQAKRS